MNLVTYQKGGGVSASTGIPTTTSLSENEQSNDNRFSSTSSRLGLGLIVIALVGVVGYNSGLGPTSLYFANTPPLLGSHHHHTKREGPPSLPTLGAPQAISGLQLPGYPPVDVQLEYEEELAKVDWNEVKQDLLELLTDSQDWWPADYGNYGGLFIRLAWHSCGSYRVSDGRGGCEGGAQRFDPERSWPDNTNLDKARRLLEPIKVKYGNGVSWGDLFALTGTVAIESMGGPTHGFCAGRVDVMDNSQTLSLGPSREQEEFGPCPVNGQCPHPLGQNTLGLIYVNPEGPMGVPDAQGAAETIRDVFGRMEWHGREIVALIGGGHTFGKAHGASTASPGLPPKECPAHSWNGPVGVNAITSGFEGPWTAHPTRWDNDYFRYLVDFEWEPIMGPGGHWQWHVKNETGPLAPMADPTSTAKQNVMMLTTDVALVTDPEYKVYVQEFADDPQAFDEAFADAWYKLVTRDMGPITRCASNNPFTPPVQHFQGPLPDPPQDFADMKDVTKDLHKLMRNNTEDQFVRLALNCANTFRATDYMGGCNGARIRFPPGSEWTINQGLDTTLDLLEPIKNKYDEGLSYADLIVLAGGVAAERLGAPPISFCPGRTDAKDGSGWKHVGYGVSECPETTKQMIQVYERRGQTAQEFVALTYITTFGSAKELKHVLESNATAVGALQEGLRYYPELRHWAEHYASAGTHEYGKDFALAWTKLMNADRFDGPVRNVCGPSPPPPDFTSEDLSRHAKHAKKH